MPLLKQFLPGCAAAAVVALVVLLLGVRLPRLRGAIGALAIAVGYVTGHLLAAGRPMFPPRAAVQWLFCIGIVSAVIGVLEAVVRHERTERDGGFAAIAWLILGGGSAVALMLSGSLLLGQLACVIGGAVAPACLLRATSRTAAFPAAAVMAGLILSGRFYAELPTASALLLGLAIACALLLPVVQLQSRWRTFALQAGVVVVPVSIALLLAYRASPPLEY